MNNKQKACFVLLLAVFGMGYGVYQLQVSTAKARKSAEAARADADTAEQQAQLASIQLKSLESKTAALRSSYEKWSPHFSAFSNAQNAEFRIAEVIREGDVFLLSQRFETSTIDQDAVVSQALVANLVVEDDYAKTLNWIGRLEEAIPSCRITKCILKRGDRGNNIHLDLEVQIPVLKG